MRVVVPQALLAIGFAGLIAAATYLARLDLARDQRLALASLGFLLSWWVVYFSSRPLRLASLRTFLDDKTELRRSAIYRDSRTDEQVGALPHDRSVKAGTASRSGHPSPDHDPVLAKAAFSAAAQGIFIAIIALFLTLVLQDRRTDDYHQLLRFLDVLLALISILLMVFAIDILDTVANQFLEGDLTPDQYRQWFYRGIGPGGPSGGISYAYFGFASFSIFIIVSMTFFFPAMAGLGVAIYAYLGYPLFFGFRLHSKGAGVGVGVDIDEDTPVIARGYGATLLVATLLVAVT